MLKPLSQLTGTTLITYDRAGYGRSDTIDRNNGVLTGVRSLEVGLHQLGYDREIMLVGHSFGAFTPRFTRNDMHVKLRLLY